MEIKNKVIVVTGGSGGIGKALSLSFIHENAKFVIALDINFDNFKSESTKLITKVCDMPGTRIYFEYELKNPEGELTTLAETTLVFVDRNGRPCMIPENFKSKIKTYFTK